MALDLMKIALRNLTNRKLRSFLTILSITIGIMSIFALVSFGLGLSNYIDEISAEMGLDKIIVQPRSAGGQTSIPEGGLNDEDVEFLSKINGVAENTGLIIKTAEIKDDENGQPKFVFLFGSDTTTEAQILMEEIMTVDIASGRQLKDGDTLKAVLGHSFTIPEKIFEKPVQLGQKIIINGHKVEAVGFYESVDNPQDDSNVYLTYEGMEILTGVKDEYVWIVNRIERGEDPKLMSEKIKERFRKHKGEEKGKETFFVQTFEELIESFGTIIGVLNSVLVMIALVSVVIAGINIMNTMYTSVIERTKQIGIMKSVGARNGSILTIFLIESGFLGMAGGAVGILLGYLVAKTGGSIAASAGYGILKPIFPLWLILSCLFFAFIVGSIAGYAPARQASKQDPVDALRYE